MIQVDNLSISYHGEALFERASFGVQPKERLGLVGRNGSGKSTLFRLLSGQETKDSGSISIRKDYKIGVLDQHIKFTEEFLIDEASKALPHDEKYDVYKAEKILFGLGFKEEDMYRPPQDFSGGYQLRLHLAKVLISKPDCLLLDEPTNYLDIVSIRWFARFLQQWGGEFVLVSHDREFMDSVTTHTIGIHRKQVKKVKGGSQEFFSQILEEEKMHESSRVKLEKKRAHAKSYIERFGAKASKAAQARSRKKLLERLPVLEALKDIHDLDFEFSKAPFPGKKMLQVSECSFCFEPDNPLISDFNLTIENGKKIAIIGKNGRGKSTILRLLAKELVPHTGEVEHSDNLSVGYFGQTNIDRLHPKHTIEKEIQLANHQLSVSDVRRICGVMMFSGSMAEKKTSVLSGGEKSRVLLGKILATPCNLLLLDEPTHHLDIESVEALIDAMEDFTGSVVLVTHSELILKRIKFDKIVICRQQNQEVFVGDYEDFLEKRGWEEEFEKPKRESKKSTKQEKGAFAEVQTQALKTLDKKIAETETKIAQNEGELQKLYEKIAKASQSRAGCEIQEYSINAACLKKELNELYHVLEVLIDQRDQLAQK